MDRMDAKWTKRTISGQKNGRARGQTGIGVPNGVCMSLVLKGKLVPERIRTSDLLLRRQTAITRYL